jgi:flagellar hook protein FlgE
MGIFGAMSTAVAGLRAQSFAIENISGNIANSQTTGFKRVDTSFVDLIPDSPPSRQLAGSVYSISRGTNGVQGDVRDSQVSTHMAINGSGMFVIDDQVGQTDGRPLFSGVYKYARRGDFSMDRSGYLKNSSNYYLKGLPVDPTTGNPSASVPEVIRITTDFQPARATTQVNYRANLAQLPRTPSYDQATANSELLFSTPPTSATYTGAAFAATGPFGAADTLTFNVAVNGGAATPVTINQATVSAIGNTNTTLDTVEEMQAAVQLALSNAGVSGVSVSTSGGAIRLSTVEVGTAASLQVSGLASTVANNTGIANFGPLAGTFSLSDFTNDPRAGGPTPYVTGLDGDDFVNRSVEGGGLTLYDAVGAPVNLQFRWAKVTNTPGNEQWNLFYLSNSEAAASEPMWRAVPSTYRFNELGRMDPQVLTVTIPSVTVNGKSLGDLTLQHGTNGLTQYQDPNGNAQLTEIDQNGYPAGELSSVSINDGGAVVGTYTNGRSQTLAVVTLATFNGVDSLKRLDGGAFAATQESGVPILGGSGNISGGSLESSNTDIADEFTKLIVTQQAYTANTRVVSTSQDMLQEALNMVR